jgi:hypothetical protein
MMLMMQMILTTNKGCYSSTLLTRISTPRVLDKKRGMVDDVFDTTKIFFLGEVDMLHHDELNSSFRIFFPTILMKRGKTQERWIFSKIEYSMVNSWKQGFINMF